MNLNYKHIYKDFFCIDVFVSSSQSLLAKVGVMSIRHYVCSTFFFFLQNVTQSTGKTITNLRLMSLSPTALLAQDFFFLLPLYCYNVQNFSSLDFFL